LAINLGIGFFVKPFRTPLADRHQEAEITAFNRQCYSFLVCMLGVISCDHQFSFYAATGHTSVGRICGPRLALLSHFLAFGLRNADTSTITDGEGNKSCGEGMQSLD
jgi:hypothetical protein